MQKKILLTGSTGFLGSHILEKLLNEGREVVILTRNQSNFQRIKYLKGFHIFEVNQQWSNIDDIFLSYSIDTIIHVATDYGRSSPISDVFLSNVNLPIKIIEIGLKYGVKLFINTDSFFSKFPGYSNLREYIISKRIFKEYLRSINELQIINLQLEHVYGENDSKGKFFPFIIDQLRTNVSEISLTDGRHKRDFIYVDDVVNAYIIVLQNKYKLNQYSDFEVGTGVSMSVRAFVEKIHFMLDSKSRLLFGAIPSRSDEILDSKANNLNLINLGWNIKFDMNSALKKIIN